MDETKEIDLLKEENNVDQVEEEQVLDTVKEKADRNSWGYAVVFGTVITFVSIVFYFFYLELEFFFCLHCQLCFFFILSRGIGLHRWSRAE